MRRHGLPAALGAPGVPLRSCQRPFLEGFRRSAPVLGSLAADSVTGRYRVAEKSVTAICAGQGHFRAPPLRSYRLFLEESHREVVKGAWRDSGEFQSPKSVTP